MAASFNTISGCGLAGVAAGLEVGRGMDLAVERGTALAVDKETNFVGGTGTGGAETVIVGVRRSFFSFFSSLRIEASS